MKLQSRVLETKFRRNATVSIKAFVDYVDKLDGAPAAGCRVWKVGGVCEYHGSERARKVG